MHPWLIRCLDLAIWAAVLLICLLVMTQGWPRGGCDSSVGSRLDAAEKARDELAARCKILEKSLHKYWENAERQDEEAEAVEKRLLALEKWAGQTETWLTKRANR